LKATFEGCPFNVETDQNGVAVFSTRKVKIYNILFNAGLLNCFIVDNWPAIGDFNAIILEYTMMIKCVHIYKTLNIRA